jgi:threonine dehydrogenase-like Zn-dependent dehydrogenase
MLATLPDAPIYGTVTPFRKRAPDKETDCRAGRPTHCPSRTVLGIRGRDGAFADYLSLPAENLHAVPDGVSDDQAVFVEPLAAALEISDQIHLRPTDRVVVLGDGKLGQLIGQVLALS